MKLMMEKSAWQAGTGNISKSHAQGGLGRLLNGSIKTVRAGHHFQKSPVQMRD
ncbi:hypothetical protein AB434_3079 [Heyndrickxia coagulans]|uniref:Uncharacterized protein n=1 Tax=Heyndrickxia coagulans TaxID=1398 RepID=A0AAN0T563_HEYCO|nr:hypothetical protein SB48_HM08orf03499 [Heyndrickxia coagulans]AKN55484.1 hypothetical protein AB434_3079 [Heyndrickxia coagulans]KYC79179.1 hypothetical protein B4096_3246 [Heyndrickxia coagulans]